MRVIEIRKRSFISSYLEGHGTGPIAGQSIVTRMTENGNFYIRVE